MATHSSTLAWRIPGMGAWWVVIYGVTQSQTRLKWLSSSSTPKRLTELDILILAHDALVDTSYCGSTASISVFHEWKTCYHHRGRYEASLTWSCPSHEHHQRSHLKSFTGVDLSLDKVFSCQSRHVWDSPSGPVVKTLCFQCRWPGFHPWLRNSDPACHVMRPKENNNKPNQRPLHCHI